MICVRQLSSRVIGWARFCHDGCKPGSETPIDVKHNRNFRRMRCGIRTSLLCKREDYGMLQFSLTDILTQGELRRARKLYRKAAPGTFTRRCASEIIQPRLERIEKSVGQTCDARNLAYCCAYVFRMEGA
jgi:hypothetical protein